MRRRSANLLVRVLGGVLSAVVAIDPASTRADKPESPPGQEQSTKGQLAAIQQQLNRLEESVARIDESTMRIEESVARIDESTMRIEESMTPCTIERWWNCECDFRDPEVTLCVALGLGGELGAEWVVEPGVAMELGAGWADGPDAKLAAQLEVPFGPIPDFAAGIKGGVGGEVTICLPTLTLDLPTSLRCVGQCVDGSFCGEVDQDCADGTACIKPRLEGRCADGTRCNARIQDCLDDTACIRPRHEGVCANGARCSTRGSDCADGSDCQGVGTALVASSLGAGDALEDFLLQLIETAEQKRAEIRESITALLRDKQLTPDRLVEPVNKLREIRAKLEDIDGVCADGAVCNNTTGPDCQDGSECKLDPVGILQSGSLRDLIDGLPAAEGMSDLLDDPSQLFPNLDPTDPFAVCRDLANSPITGPKIAQICDFADNVMPDLRELKDKIDGIVTEIQDTLCEIFPGVQCSSGDQSKAGCRKNCRQTARSCRQNCRNIDFSCKRACNNTKRSCVDGCG